MRESLNALDKLSRVMCKFCRENWESQIYSIKSSKSKTQYDFHKILLTLLKHHQASQRPGLECTECEKKRFWICGKLRSQASWKPNMTFTKFTHTFIKTPLSKSKPGWSAQDVSVYQRVLT